MELVSWDGNKFVGYPTTNRTKVYQENQASEDAYHGYITGLLTMTKRHPLIVQLSDALTEFWKTIKQSDICGECFNGNLQVYKSGVGCCSYCEFKGPTKCHAKPVACASYICGNIEDYAVNGRKIADVAFKLKHDVYMLISYDYTKTNSNYFVKGYETELVVEMTPDLERRYTIAIKLVNRLIKRYQRNPVKLNKKFTDDVSRAKAYRAQRVERKLHYQSLLLGFDSRSV